jgi:hypothetical protein
MASLKQIEANKKNAQKCCGPKTPETKAISSMNALKHGLDAKSEVIRCESEANYEALIAEYYARYNPTVPEERDLVDILIQSTWLRRRYMSIDAGVWERGFYDTGTESLGLVFERSQNAFDKAGRRINSANRTFHQALKQLRQLQAVGRTSTSAADAVPSRDCEGAVPEIPNPTPETEPLNPKLDSFLTPKLDDPETAPENPESSEKADDEPPIAA